MSAEEQMDLPFPALTPAQRLHLDVFGYVVIEDTLTTQECGVLIEALQSASQRERGASVFGYQVRDPERYGVVEFDEDDRAIAIEEKPTQPRSHWAVTGLYFYDDQVVDRRAITRGVQGKPCAEADGEHIRP